MSDDESGGGGGGDFADDLADEQAQLEHETAEMEVDDVEVDFDGNDESKPLTREEFLEQLEVAMESIDGSDETETVEDAPVSGVSKPIKPVRFNAELDFERAQYESVTSIYLTKYERARLLGVRAEQIANNAPLLCDEQDVHRLKLTDALDIAELELNLGLLPIFIRRYLPGSAHEDWDSSGLAQNIQFYGVNQKLFRVFPADDHGPEQLFVEGTGKDELTEKRQYLSTT